MIVDSYENIRKRLKVLKTIYTIEGDYAYYINKSDLFFSIISCIRNHKDGITTGHRIVWYIEPDKLTLRTLDFEEVISLLPEESVEEFLFHLDLFIGD